MRKILIIFMSLIFIFFLVGCGETSNIKIIEMEINEISNMDNFEEKMLKIMDIEKEINELSEVEKNKIKNIDLFYNELKKTSLELKHNVKWSDFLNMDVDYLILKKFINLENINKIRFIKSFSSFQFFIKNNEIINDIIHLIDVPYIDKIDLVNNANDIYDILISDSNEIYYYGLYCDSIFYANVDVYSNGYVRISTNNNNVNNVYISIVKIDFNELKNICSYGNLAKE